jgi:hypothetical protein
MKTAALQLPLAEQSELVRILLQSIEQTSKVKPNYPIMTSLGIVESDFDAATSEQVLFDEWDKRRDT